MAHTGLEMLRKFSHRQGVLPVVEWARQWGEAGMQRSKGFSRL